MIAGALMPTIRSRRIFSLVFGLLILLPELSGRLWGEDRQNLAGTWRFALDQGNRGITERWFTTSLPGRIILPSSLEAAGIGDPIGVSTAWTGSIFDRSYFTAPEYAPYRAAGNIKVPFWLQPNTHYVGAAWFQRDLDIPASWSSRQIIVCLERPHWKTSLWVDGNPWGGRDSLSVAHSYDLGTALAPGRHVLTLRIDNTLAPDIGENSHSVTDHTQGNWNGLVGQITVSAFPSPRILDLQLYPHANSRSVRFSGQVSSTATLPFPSSVRVSVRPLGGPPRPALDFPLDQQGRFSGEYFLGPGAPLWDEFSPSLLLLDATLASGDRRQVRFGLRDLAVDGHHLEINGHPLFLRGTLECAAHPRTGTPPMDVDSWRTFFHVVKDHGLNHVRFHSWCPPDEAFAAADEAGVYLQIEMASWPNQSTTLGDGKPVDAWIEAETDRILAAYGNHPSFVLACAGNEPGGDAVGPWLSHWLQRHRSTDPRHLYTSGSGWPELPENDFNVRPEPRIQHWGEGLGSRINRLPPETLTDYRTFVRSMAAPVISHEIGQWCAYPNFGEMPKYTGYLKPRNFEVFRTSLEAHHMLGQAHDFLMASGKLQSLCYKEDIESALRTPDMGGFQLLGLSDFPGQGTALVGVLDAFWEEKGYISPREFRRFCNSTVPLARLSRRVFTSDETLEAAVEITHFGPNTLEGAVAKWELVDRAGTTQEKGQFSPRDIPLGSAIPIGRLKIALADLRAPAQYRLVISIEHTEFQNDWDIWVYPASAVAATKPTVVVARRLDAGIQQKLENGAAVLLELDPATIRPDPNKGPIALGFSSIFWNTAWTRGQAPHTLGILCNPAHPALADFPTDSYTNWQWWYPVTHAAPMILDAAPPELRPIVQVIDDWFSNRKLALVFEARVGNGRLLVTSIDFEGAHLDPVRRQLRASLIGYVSGPNFNPSVSLSTNQILALSTPLR